MPAAWTTGLIAQIPTLDTLLGAYAGALGRDFEAYRNHAYRVANLCVAQSSRDGAQLEKIAIAAAFHDLGHVPSELLGSKEEALK